MKKIIWVLTLFVSCFALTGCGTSGDQLKYEGETYVPITFQQDIFSLGLSLEGEFETDVTYPIAGTLFPMIHNSGDLYCTEDRIEEANDYYQDDTNYDWYISILSAQDENIVSPIEVSEEELDCIYKLEEQEHNLAIFFDDIEQQATLIKRSKDGIVCGSIELALYEGRWYWRSEIIDESREQDGTWPEYIQPMPNCFQKKIKLQEGEKICLENWQKQTRRFQKKNASNY